ncbi:hypothetical protein BN166_1040010 [Clostridioides difficile E10]|nr:hypothetical protein BN166_1040010 [Clostridioides difficile E10]
MPTTRPKHTPASAVCDNASPNIENFLNTKIKPTQGIAMLTHRPTNKALCINP